MTYPGKPRKTDRPSRPEFVSNILKMSVSGVTARAVADAHDVKSGAAYFWLNGLEQAGILNSTGKRPAVFFLNMEVLSGKSQRVD